MRKAMWRERGGWWLLGRAHSFIHFVIQKSSFTRSQACACVTFARIQDGGLCIPILPTVFSISPALPLLGSIALAFSNHRPLPLLPSMLRRMVARCSTRSMRRSYPLQCLSKRFSRVLSCYFRWRCQ